jgi:small GTP-binding protein
MLYSNFTQENNSLSTSITPNTFDNYDYIFKIILIGDSNTGKTSLLNRYVYNKFEERYTCTIGVDFMMKQIQLKDNSIIKLQLWDTAGMERYKKITSTYYRGAQGAVVVFDLTNKTSFESVSKWVDDFKQLSNPQYHQIIFIVGNKADLVDTREVSYQEIEEYIERNEGFIYVETSAKSGDGVNKVFEDFAEGLVGKVKGMERRCDKENDVGKVISLNTKDVVVDEEGKKNGKCCGYYL